MRAGTAGLFWKDPGRVAWLVMPVGGNQGALGRRPSLKSVLQSGCRKDTPVGDNCTILTGVGVSHTF